MHIITGGHDAEQRADGDYLTKDERYARTDEYLDIVKLAWTEHKPFSYHGTYYQVEDHYSGVKSAQQPRIRLYFGGSSEAAYRVGGKHADTYALWGEPLAETKQQIDSVNEAAKNAGRTDTPGISVSFRPILGPTEELAWERAHRILETTKENIAAFRAQWGAKSWGLGGDNPQNVGSQRLLAAAAKGELHDRALWTAAGGRDRRGRQLDRPRRHPGNGRPGAARLRGHRRHDDPHPRLRPLRRRDRLRPLPAPAGPRGGRQARRRAGRRQRRPQASAGTAVRA